TLSGEHTRLVLCLAFSPDGKTLASGSEDTPIRLWDLQTGKVTATLRGDMRPVRCLAFSPDGEMLASGREGNAIKIWVSTIRGEVQKWFPASALLTKRAGTHAIPFVVIPSSTTPTPTHPKTSAPPGACWPPGMCSSGRDLTISWRSAPYGM